jgi:hypothetical protein
MHSIADNILRIGQSESELQLKYLSCEIESAEIDVSSCDTELAGFVLKMYAV